MIVWEGPIAFEGIETDDGRLVDPGALTWEPPFPLMLNTPSGDGFSIPIIGTVQEVERRSVDEDEGVTTIWGKGFIYGSDKPTMTGLAMTIVNAEFESSLAVEDDLSSTSIVHHGRVVQVVVTETPSWDGCRIQYPTHAEPTDG